ncbi:27134_t:CDS:2, partial [Gigaspora margarita]
WFNIDSSYLLCELELYNQQKYPFVEKTFNQFKGDIVLWWSHNSGAAPELSRISCQLFGICVTTASVERLFSTMGFLHSPLRCNLKVTTASTSSVLSEQEQLPEKTDDGGIYEDITLEGNWDVTINEWEELLINEEPEEEQDNLDEDEIDFLNIDIETHPAENQTVKWKLSELFVPNLPFSFDN